MLEGKGPVWAESARSGLLLPGRSVCEGSTCVDGRSLSGQGGLRLEGWICQGRAETVVVGRLRAESLGKGRSAGQDGVYRVSRVQGEGWGLLEETGAVRAESARSGCIPPGRTVCHRAGSVTMGGACQGGLRRSRSSSSLGRPGGGSVSLPGYLWTWGVLG